FGFHDYTPQRDYAAWRAAQSLPPKPKINRWFGEVDPFIIPEQSALAWGAGETIRLLHKAAGSNQSFFIRWDPSEPHLPNVVPEPYASLYPPSSIPPWLNFADALQNKPYIQQQQRRTWGIDDWTWADWAPIVGRYLGEITLLDAQIGRVLAMLEKLGLAQNTLVIYTADHGDLCGGHGLIDKHFVMYEELVRVPLLLRWPGRIAPGQRCAHFIAHALDLAATFCELAGVDQPASFTGTSLVPLLTIPDVAKEWRQDIFASYHGNQFGLYSQRMVRDERWKYVWNATAEDELYDLQHDPGEITNLAAQPALAAELARLRLRLLAWMEQSQDRLLNPWIRQQLISGSKR
ncbi:MAG: sulfatase-like hydrolase/transferase, partial [Chloroflexota bacterium]|nr:sulfatase-like hydrolase/transferase [Chloroflexota bacterium]